MPRKILNNKERHSLQFGSERITFDLSFSDRTGLGITVHPDQRVAVQAPLGKTVEEIKSRVLKKASWIVKQRD